MGYYTEYLDRGLSGDLGGLQKERSLQLGAVAAARGRDVLVIAADMDLGDRITSIDHSDITPVADLLTSLSGSALDLIVETPGGQGEVAEQIVKMLREKYDDVAIIVPGTAKSAGTIVAMSGDEILMDSSSALGPIDAQMSWQGKVFSADGLLSGLKTIREEVDQTGLLHPMYVPMLQMISPGEITRAENAQKFARDLVAEWLDRYKFKDWTTHASTTLPVTSEERSARAAEIADELCDHNRWQSHARSIRLPDLEAMRLKVTDFGKVASLSEALRRYNALLHITFDTDVYKVFETHTGAAVMRTRGAAVNTAPKPTAVPRSMRSATADVECGHCKEQIKIQAVFAGGVPLQKGAIPFPEDDRIKCPKCSRELQLGQLRQQIEAQAGKPIIGRGEHDDAGA